MAHVDAKKLKRQLSLSDYEKIINDLGIKWFSKSDTQWVLYNKDKHKDEHLQKPKLYFYPSSRNFVSYTKGCGYDIYALIQAVRATIGEACNFTDAINFVLTSTGLDPDACIRKTSKTIYNWEDDLGKYLRIRNGENGLQVYEDTILDELDQSIPEEWLDEGISEETMVKYHIGQYKRTNAITIPCQDKNGRLIGIRTRNRKPELIEQAKYVPLTLLDGTTYKFNTNSALYGLNYNWAEIERTKTVWLGESEKFVLKLDSWYSEKNVALGMFGKNLGTYRRNEILKLGVNKVIYVPDNDFIGKSQKEYDKWEKEVMQFAKLFNDYAEFEVVYDNLNLLNSKDNATDKDFETWMKLYEAREKIY